MVRAITATGTIPTTTAEVPTTADVAGGATAIECAVGGKDLIRSSWRTSGPMATLAHAHEPLPYSGAPCRDRSENQCDDDCLRSRISSGLRCFFSFRVPWVT